LILASDPRLASSQTGLEAWRKASFPARLKPARQQ
jgi:hypothetical protein